MITPLLACHGGFDLGPGLSMLLIGTLILWVAALLALIPNLLMGLRSGKSSRYSVRNLIFFAAYVFLGLLLCGGAAFEGGNLVFGIALIFVVPVMIVGHFIYLFAAWRKDRKARRVLPQETDASLPAVETKDATENPL
jgi:hypothetical protein